MPTTIERLTATVNADPAAAIAALEALSLAVDKAARDRTANVTIDVDESAADRATGVFDALGLSMDRAGSSAQRNKASMSGLSIATHTTSTAMQMLGLTLSGLQFGAVYTAATAAAGGLQMLAAAAGGAVGALAPLVGLLGSIPVGLGAIVGGIGSTLLGFSGVGAAVKAMDVAVGGAGASFNQAANNARALRDANYSLRDATEAVADAQRNLTEATKAVGEARKQAAEDIKGYARDAEDAVWREEDAVDRLRRAQENLARVQKNTGKSTVVLTKQTDDFTGKVYEVARISGEAVDQSQNEADAKREVQRAERELSRAREDGAKAAERYADAQKKGIEGSDRVQNALRQQESAARSLRRSQESLVRSQESLADTQKRIASGSGAASGGINALAKAMDNLSPAGQRFVRFLHDEFFPALKPLRFAAQEGLLPGIQKGLTSLMTIFPMVEKHIFNFAKAVGDTFANLMDHLVTPEMTKKLDAMFKGMFEVLAGSVDSSGKKMLGLLDVMQPLVDMFIAISNAATPMTKLLTNDLVGGLTRLSDKMSTVEGHDRMVKFFDNAYHFAKLWWGVLKPLAGVISDVVEASRPLAEWMLESMAKKFEELHKWTSSDEGMQSMKKWFLDMKPAISETMGLLGDLGKILFSSSVGGEESAYVKTIKSIREYVVPALASLMKALDKSDFGTEFMKFVGNIIWGIEQLVKHDGIITGIVKALNGFFNMIKGLDKASGGASTSIFLGLATALGSLKIVSKVGGWFKPLGGVFKSLGKFLKPTIEKWFPKLIPALMRLRVGFMAAAGPVGLVIGALSLLAIGFKMLWDRSDAFRNFWKGLWADIKSSAIDAWENYLKPAWNGIVDFFETQLTPMFWRFYNEVVKPVWDYIAKEIVGAWNGFIKPTLAELKRFIVEDVAPKIEWLWQEVIKPAFTEIGKFIGWVWENLIKPAFDVFLFVLTELIGPAIKSLWENIVKPIFKFIGDVIEWTWNNVIKPAFDAWWFLMSKVLIPAIKVLYNDVIKPIFKFIGDAIEFAWKKVIKPALDAFRSAFDDTGSSAWALYSAFDRAWVAIKDSFRENLNTIIRWWNQISFDVPSVDVGPVQMGGGRIDFPNIPELRQFGGKVEGGKSYIVGEKRPELLTLPKGTSGRIAAAVPRSSMESTGKGITPEQLDRILRKVLEKAKPNVDMKVDIKEPADPLLISREIAWALA